jgi:gliding motility-associated-like protein
MKAINGVMLRLMQFIILVLFTSVALAQLRADFTADYSSGCPPMVVSFKDLSTGNPTNFKWDLGNGTISYLQNPIATYFDPGAYTIKLVISNAFGADSIVKSKFIVVSGFPKPIFGASDTTGCFPLKVKFTDSSIANSGSITSWQWDFGDGTLSNEQNPVHTYINSGDFTVVLKITNSNGCSEVITKPAYIKIQNGVVANFNYSTVGCQTPAPISFTNKSTGSGVLTYTWNFGDGNRSTVANPVNTYLLPGSYSVSLIAKSSFGCTDTALMPQAINIGTVKANFTFPDTVCLSDSVQFNNTSTPATFLSSNWYFGDGSTSTTTNPAKAFAKAGIYQVKLVSNFGTCQDSIVKSVTVFDKPIASFTATNLTACKGPLSVPFTNTSQDAISYTWMFGDNTSSTEPNPVHTYVNEGVYTVTLIAKNAAGCTRTTIKRGLVRIAPPKITGIQNLLVKGCIPLSVSPVAIITDSIAGSSFLWNFGDGTTSSLAKPTHTYTTPGIFNVKLTITTATGCTDTLTIVEAVAAGVKPAPAFSATPNEVCVFTPVNFSNLTAKSDTNKFFWFFGDGGTSIETNPVYSYNDTGRFTVKLIAVSYGCADTVIKKDLIRVLPPIAKFDTSFLCSVPMTRNFVDKSIGAQTWNWNFGDGNSSTEQNPSHIYAATGNFRVELKVTNGACSHLYAQDVLVVKEHASVRISDSIACTRTPHIFNAANVNAANISSYSWYFNGIATTPYVTANNPITWVFNNAGSYAMSLVTTDILRCQDTSYAVVPVNIYGPKADFNSILSKTCFGNTIHFDDSTKTDGIHKIESWTWNFGDGNTGIFTTAQPIYYNYKSPGEYNVSLKVKDSFGCTDSINKNNFVSITKPVARFTTSDSILCPSLPITFTNHSDGVGATYMWDFGDGQKSADISPAHLFANAGTYTVKMVMMDKNGCSDSASTIIKISSALANFLMSDSFSTCPPLIVNITNKSSNFISINWDFGDGGNSQLLNPSHIYTYPGKYTVKLTVKNNGGCSDEMVKGIEIKGPTGSFDYNKKELCNPGSVTYTLKSETAIKHIWDYNDGTTIFSDKPVTTHTYTQAGYYLPKIIIEDAVGCRVPIIGADTVKVYGIKTFIKSDTKVLCDSGLISFKDSTITNDAIAAYTWSFGDGSTSTQSNPKHYYTSTGWYKVKLVTTTRFGCVDSSSVDNYLKIVASPQVKISGDSSACEMTKLNFLGEFLKTDTASVSWKWNFGNGSVSTNSRPDSQLYNTAGTYIVNVRVSNRDGCFDSVNKTVVIHPNPLVDAGSDIVVCRFSPYTLHATGADSYNWTNNSSISCTSCASPTVNPDSATTYYVNGKTIYGCRGKDSVKVGVMQPFKMSVAKADTVCAGSSITLKASGADSYLWSPSLWLNSTTIANPVAKPDSTITYAVIGSDSIGCFKDTATIRVKVFPMPKVEITNGSNLIVQVGNSVKLITKSSADVTALKWTPGQWLSCATCPEPVATPKDNITYTVTATNQGKCSTSENITLGVVCGDANVFIPNTFSPNNDGSNDVFYPRGKGLYKIKSLKIFNRWGECVFDKKEMTPNNAADGWNGTYNGAQLPSDVYVYILEVVCENSVVFPFKGTISLMR